MPRVDSSIGPISPLDRVSRIVTATAVIAALYFGSEILIPLALAILFSFVLAPAVKRLQKLGLGRTMPVLFTVLLAFLAVLAVITTMGAQLRDLTGQFPRFEAVLTRKVETLKGFTDTGTIAKIEDAARKFSEMFGRSARGPETPVAPHPRDASAALTPGASDTIVRQPVPVQVVTSGMGPLDALMLVGSPLLHPLGMAFVVLVFVVFILLQRDDLRNRAIRLFGASDLQRATAAINDGGSRLSRYLLTQLGVNAGGAIVVGGALALIGVPSPILFGMLFGLARFVPYVGPIIGAAAPLLLATAVDPGWSMLLWTGALLLVVEVVISQMIEPLAYGHNTGLSPIAIIIAATFWTVLWGPVGLLLSTPLTVCLVVLGRHVEALTFLEVLLGDQPPLSPAETFYQRLLANDPAEVADQAQRCIAETSWARYLDEVALPGLLMAQDDAAQGRLGGARQGELRGSCLEVVEDLAGEADGPENRAGAAPEALREPGRVLCIGARGPLDDAAAAFLAQALAREGFGAVAEGHGRLSRKELPGLDLSRVALICLSALDGSSPAFLRFALRRLNRHAPAAEILIATWWRRDGLTDADAEIDEAIRQPKLSTAEQALRACFAFGTAGPGPEPPAK